MSTDVPDALDVSTPAQREAMRHPSRHRITLALGIEPMTVSALSRELAMNKGNVAHHIKVLLDAGLVRRVGTRTGRGGTGTLYARAARSLQFHDRDATTGMFGAVRAGLDADRQSFAFLRAVRLTPTQTRELTAHLERWVAGLQDDDAGSPVNVFVAVARG